MRQNSKSAFDFGETIPGIDPLNFDSRDGSVSLKVTYDSRDNIFTPNDGIKGKVDSEFHRKAFGGDYAYRKDHAQIQYFNADVTNLVVGVRADYQAITDGAPFYARPYINMRGIPAMRYQGDNVALAEVEVRWDVTPRWSLISFAGSGKATDEKQNFSDSQYRNVVGGGFRYLVARLLNMRTGIDVAKGPEEWAYYIQMGHAW